MNGIRRDLYARILEVIATPEHPERVDAWRLLRLMVHDDLSNDSAVLAAAKAIMERKEPQ